MKNFSQHFPINRLIMFAVLAAVMNGFFQPFLAHGQDLSDIIFSLAWSPDGTKIAVGEAGGIRIIDAASGDIIQTLTISRGIVSDVDWSSDSSKLASASINPNGLAVWDVSTGKIVAADSINSVAVKWHPDNIILAVADTSANSGIWNSVTEEFLLFAIPGNKIDWHPDGSKLASARYDENTIFITDITTGRLLFTFVGEINGAEDIDWSPDGTKIASGGIDKIVHVWDASKGEALFALTGHTDLVTSVIWSLNSINLASGSSDGTVRFWNTRTGQSLGLIQTGGQVREIAWSPDGRQIAYGGDGIFSIVTIPKLAYKVKICP